MIPRVGAVHGLLLLTLAGVVGCGTAKAVRDLATVTAGNVSLVNTRLRAFARESELVAQERYAIVQELDDRVTEAQKELQLKLEAMKLAKDSEKLRLFEELDTILRTLAELDKQVSDRRAALQQRLDESRSPLSPPINPLTAVENALADLGKADAFGETLSFYGKFVGEVVKSVKEATATHEDAKTKTINGAKTAATAKKRDMIKDPEALKPAANPQ